MKRNVERPIQTERDDRLLRQDFVSRLLGALIEPEGRASGVVLGLTGPTGSGKSSILNMVAELAEARHPATVVVMFSPWLANPRNGLINAFFAELTAALEAGAKKPCCTQAEKLKGLAQAIFKYGKRIAPADGVWFCDGGATAAGLDSLRQSLPGGDTLRRMRAEISHELDANAVDVVVLIDEIDRLDDRAIAVCAQLARAVADFERFSYLLAYDADKLASALGNGDSERGRAYLEKIVQLAVPVPPILARQIRRILDARFRELVDEPDKHRQRLGQLLGLLTPSILGTVRDAKRALAGFEVLHGLLRFEVDEVDLLGWAAIQAKFPEVEQALRRRQEQIIGPGNRLFGEALLDRMLTGHRPASVDVTVRSEPGTREELWLEEGGEQLASGAAARPLQRLIEFLFQSPGEHHADSLIAMRSPVPLAKTLAFGTLVNVGDAGDTAPHPRYTEVIREIGDQDAAAITRALQEADRNGNLAEYLVALHGCGHRVHPKLTENIWPLDDIWSAFSDFAEPVPALTDPPRDGPNRMLAKFISGPYLHRLGPFRRFLKPNLDILREWIGNGRFALAGHLLEVQMKLELELHDEPTPAPPFLAAKDVAPLCTELGSACRSALHAGTLLGSIADLACLRAILTGAPDAWDDECRQKMDETLTQPEMLDRFIWYCFGDADPDDAHRKAAALVADHRALRDRVVDRLKEADTLPEQIRRAYQIAESKL
jgi:energy-coupling factor transporter ATP-binding protein EcfA2